MPKNEQTPLGPTADLGEFDAAMRRLVRVPKAAVDAEERKYLAMRERLRDKKRKGRKAD